jgi:hypothetical protein
MNKRRCVPPEDIKCFSSLVPFFDEYQDGVFCSCNKGVILFKNRQPYEPVKIICPTCGKEILYG